jgi:Domain of unknown function (DUF5664)
MADIKGRDHQGIWDQAAPVELAKVPHPPATLSLGGRKDSQGLKKAPWHLVPYDALGEIVKVLWYGAKKYDERNWEKGMDYSDVFGGVQRHLSAWWNREDNDPETGLSHLSHAGTGILFLLAYTLRSKGNDNRPEV